MRYELKYHEEADLLRVEIFGQRPHDSDELRRASQETWVEISRVTAEKNYNTLLVLSHATGRYNTLSAYEVNSALADCGVQKGWTIAFVNLDIASYEDVKFAETVAVNRGFTVGVFRTEDDARTWLANKER